MDESSPELTRHVVPVFVRQPGGRDESGLWREPLQRQLSIQCATNRSWRSAAISKAIHRARSEIQSYPSVQAIEQALEAATSDIRELDRRKRDILLTESDRNLQRIRYETVQRDIQHSSAEHRELIKGYRAQLFVASTLEGGMELEKGVLVVRNQNIPIRRAIRDILASSEVSNPDVRNLMEELQYLCSEEPRARKVTISDELGALERLRLGDAPQATCLSVRDSKYALSTLAMAASDGIRPVVVRDHSGLIVSRALMFAGRSQQGEPVLYLEKIYPYDSPDSIVLEILAWAQEKSNRLGRKLVISPDVRDTLSKAPHERYQRLPVLLDNDPVIPFCFSDSVREQVRGSFVVTGYSVDLGIMQSGEQAAEKTSARSS